MSLVYFLSKFSQEAILVELFLIGCVATAYFGFLLTKKKKYGVAKNAIPDNVVRAFLVEILSQTEGFKNQLFGENFKVTPGTAPKLNLGTTAAPANDADTAAIKAQLAAAIAKQDEFGKLVASLTAAKTDLEGKLAAAAAAKPASAAGAAPDKALADKVSKLEAKLAEYEVIEDDLANLKKYQQENKTLRDQIAQLTGAPAPEVIAPAAAPAAAEPVAAAPAEAAPVADAGIATPAPEEVAAAAPAPAAASPIAAAEEQVAAADANKSFEGFVDQVEQSLTPEPAAAESPSGASVGDPFAMNPTAPAATDTPAPAAEAAPAAAEAAPAAGGEATKTDADLLNEFERMLNS